MNEVLQPVRGYGGDMLILGGSQGFLGVGAVGLTTGVAEGSSRTLAITSAGASLQQAAAIPGLDSKVDAFMEAIRVE